MAEGNRVNLTAEASADIQSIFDFIAQRSPQNAAKMIEKILDAIDSLDHFSSRHKVIGRSRKTGSLVHAMVVRSFIVYYRVEIHPPAVFILTIQHGGRTQPKRFD